MRKSARRGGRRDSRAGRDCGIRVSGSCRRGGGTHGREEGEERGGEGGELRGAAQGAEGDAEVGKGFEPAPRRWCHR